MDSHSPESSSCLSSHAACYRTFTRHLDTDTPYTYLIAEHCAKDITLLRAHLTDVAIPSDESDGMQSSVVPQRAVRRSDNLPKQECGPSSPTLSLSPALPGKHQSLPHSPSRSGRKSRA